MDLIIAHLFEKSGDDLNSLKIEDLFQHFLVERFAKERSSTIEEKEHEESYEHDFDDLVF